MKKHGLKKVMIGGILAASLILTVTAAQGSESDPLVTLGYLTDQFLPRVLGEVEVKLAERDKDLESKLQAMVDTYSMEMEEKFRDAASGSGEDVANPGFTAVTISGGQKILLSAGSELLFRGGTALCTSPSSPGLVDMTSGGVLEDLSAPEINHLYLATDGNRGLAASDSVTVLVRGAYTVE